MTLVVAVDSGMIAWSSWSPVDEDPDPTELSSPTTWNGIPLDRHRLPDRIARAEELRRGLRTEHHHRSVGRLVVRGEEPPGRHRAGAHVQP